MITAYRAAGAPVALAPDGDVQALDDDIVWIDLLSPSRDEERLAERLLGIEVPTRDDLKDIEPSARLFKEKDAVFMTASLVMKSDTDAPELTDVAFILAGRRLVTVRYADPRAFRIFCAALSRLSLDTGAAVMSRLLETIIDRTAEILELQAARIDRLSVNVFDASPRRRRPQGYLERRLVDIAGHYRMVSKVRDSLASLSRLLTFHYTLPTVQDDQALKEASRTLSRDVQSLSEHVTFVAGNITFRLDASLGLINVEQNAIIKIVSVASVVFLPPTLVASIYGMNFQFMPELNWPYAYPVSLCGMVISAVVPFLVFRWKGWL